MCGLFLGAGINGWIGGGTAFALFILGRLVYGSLGAAAPPAVQAIVAGRTVRPFGGSITVMVMGPVYSFRTTVMGIATVPPLGMLTWGSFGFRTNLGTMGVTRMR